MPGGDQSPGAPSRDVLTCQNGGLAGPSRRHQQRDGTVAPAGHCRSISLHERPAAVPHPQCRLPAPLLPPALPAYLPPVARSLLPRQRPLQPEPPTRPAAAAAPGLARPEAEPGVWASAHAPGAAPPAVGPGSSQGLPAARGPPARPPRAWLRTRRPPDPLLTSRHRGRPGKRPRARVARGNAAPTHPAPEKVPERAAGGPGLSSVVFTFSKFHFAFGVEVLRTHVDNQI
uniref:Transcription factor AP-2 alpha n=1 Tax=Equus caballus TaxID=9796 RepID=A0A9L0SDB2_HORSE